MTLTQNVQFAGSLVKPLGNAARINAVAGIRVQPRQVYRRQNVERSKFDGALVFYYGFIESFPQL